MVVPFYALNYTNDYKVNDSLYLKMNTAYKGGLFVWECYYGLKSIVQTKKSNNDCILVSNIHNN